MFRRVLLSGLCTMIAAAGGCVAVSAKGVPMDARYEVISANNRIYVVDKQTKTATPVRVLDEAAAMEVPAEEP